MPKPRVLVLGGGKIGRALGGVMKPKAALSYWDKVPGVVPRQKPLAALVPSADVVFLCLPSWCLREAGTSVAPHLKKGAAVVAVSKGLESGTLLPVDALLHQVLPPGARFVFMGGPLLADELSKGQPGVGVAASADPAALRTVARLFAGTRLRVEASDDVSGVVWSAVLKNVYALGLGMTEGLGWGANARGWFVAKAVEEAGSILEDLGGRRETFHGVAGVGDMVATGFSPHSKNRSAGEALARRGKSPHVSEGMASLPQLLETLGARARRYPLLAALKAVVVEGKKARRVFEVLL